MEKLTITLDERTAAWARVYAARHNMSVSRMVRETLRERMRELYDYDDAMRRCLAKQPTKIRAQRDVYPKRDDVHSRPGCDS